MPRSITSRRSTMAGRRSSPSRPARSAAQASWTTRSPRARTQIEAGRAIETERDSAPLRLQGSQAAACLLPHLASAGRVLRGRQHALVGTGGGGDIALFQVRVAQAELWGHELRVARRELLPQGD